MGSYDSSSLNLANKFCDQFDLAKQCIVTAYDILDELNLREMPQESLTAYQGVLITSLQKCTNSLESIILLCNDRLTEDGRTIARKLIETFINIKYLSQDVGTRINRYMWHQAVLNYYTARRYIDEPRFSQVLKLGFEEALPKLRSEYDQAARYFPHNEDGEISPKFHHSWCGKTIPKMAIAAGVAEVYGQYDLFSISTHTSVRDMSAYLEPEGISFHDARDRSEVPHLLLTATGMFLRLAEIVCVGVESRLGDQITTLKQHQAELDAKSESM
jgi:hypothetical protein